MLHAFLEEGFWFLPKRYGYGSGRPIAWQGWTLLAAYVFVVLGLAFWAGSSNDIGMVAGALSSIFVATVVFTVIAYRRTKGGWRWRWGED